MTNYKQATAEVKNLVNKPEVKPVLNDAKSLTKDVSNLVSSAKEEGGALVKEGKKYVKEAAEKDFQTIQGYVKEHPFKSTAFAVLGGLFLSYFFSGSKK